MDLVNNTSLWKRFLEENGYILGQVIGHGGFGDVFSTVSSTDGVKYAIKRLVSRRNIMDDVSVVREMKALMELDHACVIRMKEILLCDKMACIVMELASKGNLEMLVHNSSLSDSFIARTFRQITRAIEFCHSCDIAHRDINPSNVLVFDTGKVKIADFGLCFWCKDAENGNNLLCSEYLGQQSYLAPEVKEEMPYHAIPADIWSLGCVVFFTVSNSRAHLENYSDDTDANIPRTENVNHHNAMGIPATDLARSRARVASETFAKEALRFASQLKRTKPTERPTASEVLQNWTKMTVDFIK